MSIDMRKPPLAGTSDDLPPVLVERVRPSARCGVCGDGVVEAVCSNCARLLCEKHVIATGPLGPRAILELHRARPAGPTRKAGATKAGAAGKAGAGKAGAAGKADAAGKTESAGQAGAAGTAEATGKPEATGEAADAAPEPSEPKQDEPPTEPAEEPEDEDDAGQSGERLGERPRGSVHRRYCARCAPRMRPLDPELVAASTTTGLGAAVLPVQSVVGILLLSVGVVRFAVRTIIGIRRRSEQVGGHSADLPLNPNLRKIKAKERITGTIRLHPDRRVEATVDEVSGSVTIEGNWSRIHRAEVDRYERRTQSAPVSVSAGHLVLHGPGRVAFQPAADAAGNGGPALVLEPRVADQPILSSADGLGETQWHPEFRYDITPPDDGWRVPVWISPNIAAGLDRHVLKLHVQWCTRDPGRDVAGVPLRAIEVLEIAVPAHWGTVEHMTPLGGDTYSGQPRAGEDDGPARRTLTWKKIPFKESSDRGAVQLTVRFSERIDLDHELTGRIEARFAGAVSGLTRTVVYRTDGGPVHRLDGMNTPVSLAEVTFTLSLQGLRYQEQRAIPDRSRADDVARRETETFLGVIPDHRTVALLTNNLADEGYSVIRIQENPAQSSPRPDTVNRLWDLSGRYYDGVYPIEFHLQLVGEETHKGRQVSGSTAVSLTVHGSYANAEMERRVVEEWTRLWKRIRLCLEGSGDGPRPAEQPLDAASSELARLRNVALTEIARLRAAADSGRIDSDLAAEMIDRITREFGLGEG